MHHENLDYERHCKYQIGEYMQAHDEPPHTNTNASRSLDCIYLRPMDNAQGGHELLHLQTNKVVKRRKLTKIPITPSIIKQVHALAVLDGMPEGLKIKNRANNIIFDSAWTAGVDYDEDFDDDDYNDGEEEDIEEDDEENYDEMDENELADILQAPNGSNIQRESGNTTQEHQDHEHEIVFEELKKQLTLTKKFKLKSYLKTTTMKILFQITKKTSRSKRMTKTAKKKIMKESVAPQE